MHCVTNCFDSPHQMHFLRTEIDNRTIQTCVFPTCICELSLGLDSCRNLAHVFLDPRATTGLRILFRLLSIMYRYYIVHLEYRSQRRVHSMNSPISINLVYQAFNLLFLPPSSPSNSTGSTQALTIP